MDILLVRVFYQHCFLWGLVGFIFQLIKLVKSLLLGKNQ